MDELNYIVGQHTQSLIRQEVKMNATERFMRIDENQKKQKSNYLKILLIYRARKRFPTKVNNYIFTLCESYDFHMPNMPPFLDEDTTPAWVIADMILCEKNEKDLESLTDIFKYTYEVLPTSFFPNST